MPNWEQISGIVERVLLVLLTYLATKGYIAGESVAGLATLVLGVLGAVWAWWVNRPAALAKAAAAQPAVTVTTTDPKLATGPGPNDVKLTPK